MIRSSVAASVGSHASAARVLTSLLCRLRRLRSEALPGSAATAACKRQPRGVLAAIQSPTRVRMASIGKIGNVISDSWATVNADGLVRRIQTAMGLSSWLQIREGLLLPS